MRCIRGTTEVLPRKGFTTEAVKETCYQGNEGHAQVLETNYLDSPQGSGLVYQWMWSKNLFDF